MASRIVPYAIINLVDIDRQSGIMRDAILASSMEGLGLASLFLVGCFCITSPRWREIGRADRIFLVVISILYIFGAVFTAITTRAFTGRMPWVDTTCFFLVFLALAGPAIFLGSGHLSIIEKIKKRK
jgi:hypothetical protein